MSVESVGAEGFQGAVGTRWLCSGFPQGQHFPQIVAPAVFTRPINPRLPFACRFIQLAPGRGYRGWVPFTRSKPRLVGPFYVIEISRPPSFGGILVEGDSQLVTATANAQALVGEPSPRIQLRLLDPARTEVLTAEGNDSAAFSQFLSEGYYTLEVRSLSGKGKFQLGLSSDHFSGGVVMGGYIEAEPVVGFGGFNILSRQEVNFRLFRSAYGAFASGQLEFTLLDSQGGAVPLSAVVP